MANRPAEVLTGEIVPHRPGLPARVVSQAQIDRTVEFADEVLETMGHGLAPNTWTAYRKAWRRYLHWCTAGSRRRTPVPASLETLKSYVISMKHDDLSVSTVRVALAALRRVHGWGDPPAPWEGNHSDIRDLVVGYAKERKRAGKEIKRAAGARTTIMRALADTCDDSPSGLRDRALLLLGYHMAARRSELAGLRIADLRYDDDGLEAYVAYSKTDQVGDGVWVAVPRNSGSPQYCPVRAVGVWVAYLAAAGLTDGPLFRPVNKHGQVRRSRMQMSGSSFEVAINRAVSRAIAMARAAGNDQLVRMLESRRLTPHSLRRGFASDARASQWDLLDITRHGRWSPQSKSVHIYIEEADKWMRHSQKPVQL